jgi:predicted nuclease of predicted toxin-antitoxin system
MKFHTDENVSDAVALGLARRGIDTTTTTQAGLRGVSDEEQIAHCSKQQRILVTHDADILRLAASGTSHSGIAYCHIRQLKTGTLILKLLALAARVTVAEMKDRIEFL